MARSRTAKLLSMPGIRPLRDGPRERVPEIRNAYRFLRGAHTSVEGLFAGAEQLIEARRRTNASTGGRLHTDEVNVLRAAIVFTSSGLDASMKRLVNDAGRYLITQPTRTGAREEFEQFLKNQLSAPEVDQRLRSAIIDPRATTKILNYYLSVRTKASFQGSGDLDTRVRKALGISGARVTQTQLKTLDKFFLSRNNIVHAMDYVNVNTSSSRARHHRTIEQAASLCNNAFGVAADLIHAASEVVLSTR